MDAKRLKELWNIAVRDDAFTHMVPSDVRELIRGVERAQEALESVALLDEADGHELTREHALKAVAIATSALGKHPSEIKATRQQ